MMIYAWTWTETHNFNNFSVNFSPCWLCFLGLHQCWDASYLFVCVCFCFCFFLTLIWIEACFKSYNSHRKICSLSHHHLIKQSRFDASQVLGIGVTTGSSLFGLFQAKVSAFPKMKWSICMQFIMMLVSHIISILKYQELRLCLMASRVGISSSFSHQKKLQFMERLNGGVPC